MAYLWFDPNAEPASHIPPYKRLDPSRPIVRQQAKPADEPQQFAYVASEHLSGFASS